MDVQIRMTADEFLALPETNRPTELIDGDVYRMSSPTPDHQDVVYDTATLVKQLTKGKGGRTFVAPLDVYFDDINVFQPDVMWVAPDSQCEILPKYLRGAPDLIAEVLSPGNKDYDEDVKLTAYAKAGVPEYVVIDAWKKQLRLYSQPMNGEYGALQKFNANDRVTFAGVPEITLVVGDLFTGSPDETL